MQDLTPYMDPFFGNGTIDLPQAEGIAATWFYIKAQTGNTNPGACAPFGMLSACAYSGAYPTGYGLNAPNYNSTPPQRFEELVASGFTHLQQSGTGAIDTYYNYLRVTPLPGDLGQLGTRWALEDETASPGYYAVTLKGAGIRAELTASPRAALHRYTFPQAVKPCLAIDFSIGGIDFPRMRTYATEAEIAATIRFLTPEMQKLLHAEIEKALSVARALGGDYQHSFDDGYPPTVNDAGVADLMREVATDLLGAEHIAPPEASMGSEDFGFFSAHAPGAMLRDACVSCWT